MASLHRRAESGLADDGDGRVSARVADVQLRLQRGESDSRSQTLSLLQ